MTAGKAGVLFIMVNPYWQDFDEGFRVAVDKTSGAAPGTNRFKQWWYGQPIDFSSIKAMLAIHNRRKEKKLAHILKYNQVNN